MADIKTKPTGVKVEDFLAGVSEVKQKDSYVLIAMMEKITGEKAVMWGPSIVGFGKYHYKYESGHEADMCIAGFSPRKTNLVIYLMTGFEGKKDLLSKLGKHKTSKTCLYINKLSDVNVEVLEKLIRWSVEHSSSNLST